MPFIVVQYLNNVQLFCNPMDCSLLGISDQAISQVRIQECVAISFSRVSSRPRDQTMSPAQAGRFFTSEAPGKPLEMSYIHGKRIYMYVCIYICVSVCICGHWERKSLQYSEDTILTTVNFYIMKNDMPMVNMLYCINVSHLSYELLLSQQF